ncbi:MAG TPA: AAA family ATPase, partial [Gemmatimonadales bacterium]|nr:AAA family ATPase [Gemmatimonadales bacterium]
MTIEPPATRLCLKTLGPVPRLVQVTAEGETLLFGAGKPLAIIVYLSMAPGHTASRVHLTDLLWADSDIERARQSLRQAVWQIRRKLGETALLGDGEQLTLHLPIQSDHAEVGAALRNAEFEEVLRLYEGDFLREFGVPGGAGFEHWADKARDRLRGGWIRALDAVARERLNRGAVREAVALARQHRDADPANEAAWRFLLDTLLLAGDPIGAGLEADALEALLAEERREPEPQTVPFLARVRAMPPPAAPSTSPVLSTELIGREGEFRRITQAWEHSRAGEGRHLHLSAPAGLGKTRLLRDAERRLRAMGGRILYLRAPPGSRQIAYAFAAELARTLIALPGASGVTPAALATLQALDPSLVTGFGGAPDPSTGTEALRRRTLALADLLLALLEESPLALLIDDVHWMDGESLQLLAGLRARLTGSAALLVTAGRPVRGQELVEADAEVLTLTPLTAAEVEALIMSVGALPD